jgi:hypothetical protein
MTGVLVDEAGVRTVADPADIRQSGGSRRVPLTSSEESGPLARHGWPNSASTWPTSDGRCGSDKRDGCSLDVRGCAPRAALDRRVGPNESTSTSRACSTVPPSENLSRIEFLEALRAEKPDITLEALCDRLLAERGVRADTSMMTRFFRCIGVTLKKDAYRARAGSYGHKTPRPSQTSRCPQGLRMVIRENGARGVLGSE